jgi:hypothetical protein
MILSRGRRFIFVHIPKTGGTALALALEGRAMKDDILIGDTPKARARSRRWRGVKAYGRLWKHSTLADIAGLASDDEIAASFTFTLVRNPWDRALSYYSWLRVQGFAHPSVALAKTLPFDAFLRHPQIRTAFRLWPARAYMTDRTGTERASAFVRLEHLETDLAPVEAHLGFRLAPLPRANASDRPLDWRAAYTDDLARIVAEDCSEDIARFGYRFDP